MKILCFASALVLAASAPYTFSSDKVESSFTGNINTLFGIKQLDKDDWDDFGKHYKNQFEFGITSDFGMDSWPVLITGSYLHSSKSKQERDDLMLSGKSKFTIEMDEIRLGVKKAFKISDANPYVSLGVAWISATIKDEMSREHEKVTYSLNDSAVGGFFAAGVTWTFLEHLNIGTEVSYSIADVDFGNEEGEKIKIGGLHAGFLIGYHF